MFESESENKVREVREDCETRNDDQRRSSEARLARTKESDREVKDSKQASCTCRDRRKSEGEEAGVKGRRESEETPRCVEVEPDSRRPSACARRLQEVVKEYGKGRISFLSTPQHTLSPDRGVALRPEPPPRSRSLRGGPHAAAASRPRGLARLTLLLFPEACGALTTQRSQEQSEEVRTSATR